MIDARRIKRSWPALGACRPCHISARAGLRIAAPRNVNRPPKSSCAQATRVHLPHDRRRAIQPVLSDLERMTLLGFLAAYRGYTRVADAFDLRHFTAWCWQQHHHLFDARRVDIECFARDLQDRGKARATKTDGGWLWIMRRPRCGRGELGGGRSDRWCPRRSHRGSWTCGV